TLWLAMDENTAGNNSGIPNFTRVTSTHYLLDCVDATQPVMAADSQLLMKVVTAGGAITPVYDLRNSCVLVGWGGGALNGIINVEDFGAQGDAVTGTDGTVADGSKNFSTPSLSCTESRIGETVHVIAAATSAALLETTVSSCSGSTFVMTTSAQEDISGTAKWIVGHDDTADIQAAFNTSYANSFSTNAVYFPGGRYLVTSPLNFTGINYTHLYGAGQFLSTILCSSTGYSVCVDVSGG